MKGALTNGAVTSNMFLSFGSSPRTSVISRLIKVVLGSAEGQCCLIKNPSGTENLAGGEQCSDTSTVATRPKALQCRCLAGRARCPWGGQILRCVAAVLEDPEDLQRSSITR